MLPTLRHMEQRDEIASVRELRHVYQVTVPYAMLAPLDEYEILMEAHPYCTLSHASAFSFHSLTGDIEQEITVTTASKTPAGLLPSGTVIEDWEGLSLPAGTKTLQVLDRPVTWSQVESRHYFGINEYHRFGYPLRVTNRERTLLDGLRSPDLCGGLENVLRAWALSRDVLSIDTLVEYVDRLDINVLRQRVGFIIDTLGISHPILKQWQRLAKRGGSSKLLGSAPYSTGDGVAQFSEEWKLAINAPITALQAAEG